MKKTKTTAISEEIWAEIETLRGQTQTAYAEAVEAEQVYLPKLDTFRRTNQLLAAFVGGVAGGAGVSLATHKLGDRCFEPKTEEEIEAEQKEAERQKAEQQASARAVLGIEEAEA